MIRNDTRPTILLVDQNPRVSSLIRRALEGHGFQCTEAADEDEAVYQAEAVRPDLFLLDVALGGKNAGGLEVCRRVRALGFTMPVIFLSSEAKVEYLNYGLTIAGPGSDFVRKLPERPREIASPSYEMPDVQELLVRIRARLDGGLKQLGPDLRIDIRRRRVERLTDTRWIEVRLQPLEFEVIRALIDANGAAIGTWDLFQTVFRGGIQDTDEFEDPNKYRNRIWVSIANIRRKIDPESIHKYIQTLHGIGYQFNITESR
jgi:two-component system response regulator MprA